MGGEEDDNDDDDADGKCAIKIMDLEHVNINMSGEFRVEAFLMYRCLFHFWNREVVWGGFILWIAMDGDGTDALRDFWSELSVWD